MSIWCGGTGTIYRGGCGSLGYQHLSSGISVSRPCPSGVPLAVIDAELLAELRERLRAEGLPAELNGLGADA